MQDPKIDQDAETDCKMLGNAIMSSGEKQKYDRKNNAGKRWLKVSAVQ